MLFSPVEGSKNVCSQTLAMFLNLFSLNIFYQVRMQCWINVRLSWKNRDAISLYKYLDQIVCPIANPVKIFVFVLETKERKLVSNLKIIRFENPDRGTYQCAAVRTYNALIMTPPQLKQRLRRKAQSVTNSNFRQLVRTIWKFRELTCANESSEHRSRMEVQARKAGYRR